MSDGELHASLGLHRGRRALAAVLALGLAAVLLSAVSREPAVEAITPPPRAETATPPKQTAQPVRRKPRATKTIIATKPTLARPLTVAAIVNESRDPLDSARGEREPLETARSEPLDSARGERDDPPQGNGESIARAIAAEKRAAVRACFENELKQQPTLAGTVIVELDLAPPARVDAVRVSDDLNRPAFTRCVASAMQNARFAMLDEEISVSVPYVLSPERK